jgi:hypothetical protein
MRRTILNLALAVSAVAVAACGQSASPAPSPQISSSNDASVPKDAGEPVTTCTAVACSPCRPYADVPCQQYVCFDPTNRTYYPDWEPQWRYPDHDSAATAACFPGKCVQRRPCATLPESECPSTLGDDLSVCFYHPSACCQIYNTSLHKCDVDEEASAPKTADQCAAEGLQPDPYVCAEGFADRGCSSLVDQKGCESNAACAWSTVPPPYDTLDGGSHDGG